MLCINTVRKLKTNIFLSQLSRSCLLHLPSQTRVLHFWGINRIMWRILANWKDFLETCISLKIRLSILSVLWKKLVLSIKMKIWFNRRETTLLLNRLEAISLFIFKESPKDSFEIFKMLHTYKITLKIYFISRNFIPSDLINDNNNLWHNKKHKIIINLFLYKVKLTNILLFFPIFNFWIKYFLNFLSN